jgi:hypothetical protein
MTPFHKATNLVLGLGGLPFTLYAVVELLFRGCAHRLAHGLFHHECQECWRREAEKLMRRQVDRIVPRRVRG